LDGKAGEAQAQATRLAFVTCITRHCKEQHFSGAGETRECAPNVGEERRTVAHRAMSGHRVR